jgi:carboxylesterase type B
MTILSLFSAFCTVAALATSEVEALPSTQQAPTVATKNGSYYGIYSSSFDQDFFLGMPFAQPPVGDLRFANPVPLNSSWSGTRNATEYGFWCPGYYNDDGYVPNEDCLTINVIRPAGYENQSLPVATWIFGGGFFAVSTSKNPD